MNNKHKYYSFIIALSIFIFWEINEYFELIDTWNSTSTSVNGNNGKMFCTYRASGVNDADEGIGLMEYTLIRKNARATTMATCSFSTNIKVDKRIKTYQKKIDKKFE